MHTDKQHKTMHTGTGRELTHARHLLCAGHSDGHFKFYLMSTNGPVNRTKMKSPKSPPLPPSCPRPLLAYRLLGCKFEMQPHTREAVRDGSPVSLCAGNNHSPEDV